MSKKRAEGQLWIDRSAPHGLKYYADGETYQLSSENSYKIITTVGIPAGSIVAACTVVEDDVTYETFRPAQFPRDINRVIGICPIDIPAPTAPDTVTEVEGISVIKSGIIELSISNSSSIFQHEGITIDNWKNMVGAPVYWFIGRSYKKVENGNTTYLYIDPARNNNEGKLTLATPSGMKWGLGIECDDNEFNVGYSNLPTVGTVVAVDSEKNTVTINVNISKFESALEWHWPYCLKYRNGQNKLQSDKIVIESSVGAIVEVPYKIRHGLFPNTTGPQEENYYNFRTRCFCNAIIIDSDNDDTEHLGLVKTENYYGLNEGEPGDTEKRTEIILKGRDTLLNEKRINVSGKVVYEFVKQYE